jgi:site-specific recombinase XerD
MSKHINTHERAHTMSECIDYYEICNKAEGKSPRTINWYSANLRLFRNYLKNRRLPDSIDNIDTELLREYVIYLLKKNRFDGRYMEVSVCDTLMCFVGYR